MTPERKKYLASISKEEHIIRLKIIKLKARMKSEKFWLNHDKCNKKQIQQTCWRIYCIKTVIKILKKQLSAPTKSLINYHCNCPKCNFFVDGENDNYCYNCGQKLR